jgi:ankyrin repeat protein/uncharacterized glyoxalase superfamily protein PhnB
MSDSQFPERVSLEYLKKLAKERLRELRVKHSGTKLAAAQLEIAREHGFGSWRAMKAEVGRRLGGDTALFFEACTRGDADAIRGLLARDPGLVRAANPAAPHGGWTGLHTAAQRAHLDVVRLLLELGADPNAREAGDNTYPLHWAAANRCLDAVRLLLDAGGDAHGTGDVHELDAIGWATFFHEEGGAPGDRPEVAALLVERGARHHIFSAIALGDADLVRTVVKHDRDAPQRRMSRFEQRQTPIEFAIRWKREEIVDLLIELGADLNGALESAMLRGDRQAAKRLTAAGAKEPPKADAATVRARMTGLMEHVGKCVPMIYVPDVAAALDWYTAIGFEEMARYGEGSLVNFGMVRFGKAEIMLNMHGRNGEHDVSLWLYTDRVDELYRVLKSRHIGDFVEDLNDTFYGAREFGIRDLNGYVLYFIQLLDSAS